MTKTASALEVQKDGGGVRLKFSGHLNAEAVAEVWNEAVTAAQDGNATADLSGVEYCDGAGLALLCELRDRRKATLTGLSPEVEKLLEPYKEMKAPEAEPRPESNIVRLGRIGSDFVRDTRELVEFLGEASWMLTRCFFNPRLVRWSDMWMTVQKAGVNALLIVGMISFLTGLILAFEAITTLKQWGADIFVVNLVGFSMVREMGPIMTAIVLAGRSGSAFAAEIGTMKVNEEINALNTMGLDPVRFLVMPRLIAGVIVTPLLTIYSDVLGIAGGFSVMLSEGYPWALLWKQLTVAIAIHDLLSGVVKSFFFGILVAGIGCLRGLQTKSGASAVGESTTSSVVSGIFLIVVADAIFAVLFYVIGF